MSQPATAPTSKGQVNLLNVRISYPKLFEAEGMKNDPNSRPKYSATFLIPKTDKATLAAIQTEIDRLAKEAKVKGFTDRELCIHDGDLKNDEGYVGCMYITASRYPEKNRPNRPGVVDRDNTPLSAEDCKIYPGCRVDAVIQIYSTKGWKGAFAGLEGVRFRGDDTPLAGRAPVNMAAALPDIPEDDGFDS